MFHSQVWLKPVALALLALLTEAKLSRGQEALLEPGPAAEAVAGPVWLNGMEVPDATPLEFRVDGELVSALRLEPGHQPCWYPLCAAGGIEVTRGYPLNPQPGDSDDHPHHRSLWVAHGDVKGVDYWAGKGKTRTESVSVSTSDREMTADVEETLFSADEKPLARQFSRWKLSAGETLRTVDLQLRLEPAAGDLVFGDTKEGFFALRLHDELRPDRAVANQSDGSLAVVRNSAGDRGAGVWGQRARWVSYQGPREGQVVSVAMFDHPENLRFPTTWHARDYGLFAANPFGLHDFLGEPPGTGAFRVAAGQAICFRYRVLIAAAELDDMAIESAYADFAGTPHLESGFPAVRAKESPAGAGD